MKKEQRPNFLTDQFGNVYQISWIKTRARNHIKNGKYVDKGEPYYRFESYRFLLSDLKPEEEK